MAVAVGAVLAGAVAGFGRLAGFDRDRSYYPTVLIVVASYYVLFAVMGGSTRAVVLESMLMAAFAVVAVAGAAHGAWIVVAGLAAHGVGDVYHTHIVDNPGVPVWWPPFCLAFDVVAAASLGWLSSDGWRRTPATPAVHDPMARHGWLRRLTQYASLDMALKRVRRPNADARPRG